MHEKRAHRGEVLENITSSEASAKGLVSTTKSPDGEEDSSDDDNVVCLVVGEGFLSGTAPRWAVDTAATLHMCHDRSFLEEVLEIAPLSIKTDHDSDVNARRKGARCCQINAWGSV